MKKILLLTLLGVLTASLLAAEGGIEFSGEIETLWGVGAPWTDKDNSAGRFTLGNTSLTGQLDAYFGNSSAYAEATFSYDATGAINGSGAGGNLGSGFDLSLNELWLDYTDSFWGIRVGRQKAAWGKADGIDITNILCPSDMSSFAAMTGDDSKLAVDAIRLSFSADQFTADAYWIPFFTPAALPLDEGNALRKYLVPESIYVDFAPGISFTLPVSIGDINTPEIAIWNGEYGLKLSGYFSALDFSLYGFYGWDDLPILDYSKNMNAMSMPESITVAGHYERVIMAGADAALPIGETVIRLETAFYPQRHFQKSEGGSEQRNQLSALAGIDWMPSGWTLTAQYYCDVVFGDLDTLERDQAYKHGATLSISKSLVNETLELSLAGVIGFNDFDSMISPSVKYSISDQISAGISAIVFIPGPERQGKYGAYKDLSSLCINAKFSF